MTSSISRLKSLDQGATSGLYGGCAAVRRFFGIKNRPDDYRDGVVWVVGRWESLADLPKRRRGTGRLFCRPRREAIGGLDDPRADLTVGAKRPVRRPVVGGNPDLVSQDLDREVGANQLVDQLAAQLGILDRCQDLENSQ